MAKFVDYHSDRFVAEIMEETLNRFPSLFEGFDISRVGFVTTRNKKRGSVLKVHRVSYPHDAFLSKTYIVEMNEIRWDKLDQKRKNLSVFKIMCSIPNGGFDENSKLYGKILKPDIQMYLQEYAAAGCIVNWEENPAAKDPMCAEEDEDLEKVAQAQEDEENA